MFNFEQQQQFIKKANALTPQLKRWVVPIEKLATPVFDENVWQNYTMKQSDLQEFLSTHSFANGDSFIVALPETLVGQLAFRLSSLQGYADSPSRLRITLGELPQEVVFADKPYNGTLNGSWLQSEVINIDDLPMDVVLPRRYCCKYIRFDMIGVPRRINFDNIRFIACGAEDHLAEVDKSLSPILQEIDRASIRTLRNCMQTCFEDGPKRDRRLWLGDLRLQAMVNKVTYKRFDLVKRSLYLLAGALQNDGEVSGCVMERPYPRKGCHTHDYTMLFSLVLYEYCRDSGDWALGEELFDLACHQMQLMERFFEKGLFIGENDPYKDWFFVDHDLELDRQAAVQAQAIVGYNYLAKLSEKLGKSEKASAFREKVELLSKVARDKFYDSQTGVVVSGEKLQISYASQIWMILAGVLNPEEGKRALLAVEKNQSALKPSSPYMFHYLLEAWQICGDEKHLMELLEEYYGSMVKHGADTFWEAYRPEDPFFSPYNDVRMNSACHAWSGTASYFIRKGYLQ